MLTDQINELMNKEVDRKEFLAHIGIGLVALTGISGVLKALLKDTDSSQVSSGRPKAASKGYGSSGYGV